MQQPQLLKSMGEDTQLVLHVTLQQNQSIN
jgi:hypothetical protein